MKKTIIHYGFLILFIMFSDVIFLQAQKNQCDSLIEDMRKAYLKGDFKALVTNLNTALDNSSPSPTSNSPFCDKTKIEDFFQFMKLLSSRITNLIPFSNLDSTRNEGLEKFKKEQSAKDQFLTYC